MADTVIIRGDTQRAYAAQMAKVAPVGTIITHREATRSDEQNRKMWAMLKDISRAEPMGRKHTPDDWKALAMNACGWECQFIEGLDGRPFPQGFRSSKMNTRQMGMLIEWMYAFGADHDVRWSEPGYADPQGTS